MKKKTVFVSGHFNILHPGHLRFLKFAKERGDTLVVAVESNKIAGESAYVDEKTRLNSIKSISLVDKAFILRRPVIEYIKINKPTIVVKGKEFEDLFNEESEVLKKYGPSDNQIEITTLADIPSGTGLGSSGSFTTALIKSLYASNQKHISQKDLAEAACEIEIDILGEPIGKQNDELPN